MTWQWNGVRRAWTQDDRSIYPTEGGFVIAESESWLPGCYGDRRAAEVSFEQPLERLQRLQDTKNAEAGGAGGVITASDLECGT